MYAKPWTTLSICLITLTLAACGGSATAMPTSPPNPPPASAASPAQPTPEDPTPTATTFVPPDGTPDLIFHNGVVLTMAGGTPLAGALAVSSERIVAVGPEEDVLPLAGEDTRLVDLEGRTLMPGFVDAHTHLFNDHDAFETDLTGAQELALQNGITTLGNMYASEEFLQEMQAFDDAGELIVRTSLYLSITTNCGEPTGDWWQAYAPTRDPGERLRIGGLKAFADGGTCREIAASQDILPDYGRGELFFSQEEMQAMFSQAQGLGYQLAVHAQGDNAIEQVLNAIGSVTQDGANPLRHRIEHNSLVRPELRPLYGQYDVVATLFGYHPVCDMPAWTSFYQTIGEDLHGLLAANPDGHFAWHGDDPPWPPLNPLLDLASMVTRVEPDGAGGLCEPPDWLAEKAITVEQGLHLMTTGAAYSLFREEEVGSLQVGKYADLVVLNGDPTDVDPRGLWDLRVLATLVGGDLVYCADEVQSMCAGLERISASASPSEEAPSIPSSAETVVQNVRVSGEVPDFPAVGAVDGVTDDTPWVSGDDAPQWIELDLGQIRSVTGLKLWVDQDPAGFTRHLILGGPDPDPAQQLAVLEGETTWGQMLEVEGDWQVRYLRIETVESPSWVAWLELEVLVEQP
jgi:predicted amidohydrolase YtcJ